MYPQGQPARPSDHDGPFRRVFYTTRAARKRLVHLVAVLAVIAASSVGVAVNAPPGVAAGGDDWNLVGSATIDPGSPIVQPQSVQFVSVEITNDGTDPAPPLTAMPRLSVPNPDDPDGPAYVQPIDLGHYSQVYEIDGGGWEMNNSGQVPSIPVGSTMTISASLAWPSAPLVFTGPGGATITAAPGDTIDTVIDFAPQDATEAVALSVSASTQLSDYALFEVTVAPQNTPPIPHHVADSQTFTVSIHNAGTDASWWVGTFGTLDDPGTYKLAWPDSVSTINGVSRFDPVGTLVINQPEVRCNIEGPERTTFCLSETVLEPGQTVTMDLTFTYGDDWLATADDPFANFVGDVRFQVAGGSSDDFTNCEYKDLDASPDCFAAWPYSVIGQVGTVADSVDPSPDVVESGDLIDWTITYHNAAETEPATPDENRIWVPIELGQEYVDVSPGWSCSPVDWMAPGAPSGVIELYLCEPDPGRALSAGAAETFAVTTRALPDAETGTWVGAWDFTTDTYSEDQNTFDACAIDPGPLRVDPSPMPPGMGDCGVATGIEIWVPGPPELSIVKSADESTVEPGDSFTWTITVTNNGESPDTGVVITDTLPEGVTPDSTPTGCDITGGDLTCDIGELAVGESFTATIPVTVSDPLPAGVAEAGELVNTAWVTGENGNCVEGCSSMAIVEVTDTDDSGPSTTLPTITTTASPTTTVEPTTTITPPSSTVPPIIEGPGGTGPGDNPDDTDHTSAPDPPGSYAPYAGGTSHMPDHSGDQSLNAADIRGDQDPSASPVADAPNGQDRTTGHGELPATGSSAGSAMIAGLILGATGALMLIVTTRRRRECLAD